MLLCAPCLRHSIDWAFIIGQMVIAFHTKLQRLINIPLVYIFTKTDWFIRKCTHLEYVHKLQIEFAFVWLEIVKVRCPSSQWNQSIVLHNNEKINKCITRMAELSSINNDFLKVRVDTRSLRVRAGYMYAVHDVTFILYVVAVHISFCFSLFADDISAELTNSQWHFASLLLRKL